MRRRVPSFFLLVPGPWLSIEAIVAALARGGVAARPMDETPIAPEEVRVDRVDEPAGFGAAMRTGRFGPLSPALIAAAGASRHAALIELGFRLQDDVGRVVSVGRALRAAGGIAVRVESSGGASDWETWLDALERGGPVGLLHAATVVVGEKGEGLFTCGMHAFDLPEAEIELADLDEAFEWVEMLCAFQIAERPALATGHTFQPNATRTRRRLERWPDGRHHPDDGRYNPYGCWRLVPDDAAALPAENPVPVIMPALVVQLSAAERQAGRALTEAEVESITSKSPAIALALEDANALERSRGYADLEPRRAWAQWQLLRSHGG